MPNNKTKSTVLFKSEGGNLYLYDRKMKKTILCHPVLYSIAQMRIQGKDVSHWIEIQNKEMIDIPNLGKFPKDVVMHYYKKFLFLVAAGFFSEIFQSEQLTRELTKETVEATLANLLQVTFELTDACQMACYYCGYGRLYDKYDKRENKHMDFFLIKRTLDYLQGLLNSPLNLSYKRPLYIGFYGGEPLLDFHLIEKTVNYVKLLEWQHNTLRFTITTNGLLIDKYIDFFAQHNFNIFISLDGDEKNNAYRVLKNGNPTYGKVLANVELLANKYPDFF